MLLPKALASGFVPPCIPARATKPPAGPDWLHEIKHDGYRLVVRRDGGAARLFTRRGHDWTERYPARRRIEPLLVQLGDAAVGAGRCCWLLKSRPLPGERASH